MSTNDDARLAKLLGDAAGTSGRIDPHLGDDRRARRALAALDALYGDLRVRPIVYWDAIATPIGRVLVAVSDAGLVRVGFRQTTVTAFAAQLAQQLDADVVRSPARTAHAVRQLRAYFAGRLRGFELPIDLGGLSAFQRRVLMATAAIPAGRLASYGDIARRIGRPGGSRAVGQALGRNPVPIVIPCHRVIAAGGRIGGYAGGLGIKRTLLRLEGTLAEVA
jgi:methylated-DNA-[protein]-cysteine S-methyltransferase